VILQSNNYQQINIKLINNTRNITLIKDLKKPTNPKQEPKKNLGFYQLLDAKDHRNRKRQKWEVLDSRLTV